MTVTLKPVLDALGYPHAPQQRAVVKLLQASGAFGQVPGVDGVPDDRQCDAILNSLTFPSLPQAARVLHAVTQEHMIRRPPGAERIDCREPDAFRAQRAALMQALDDAGMTGPVKPGRPYYDHVLVMGATEAEVDGRLDYLKQLWDQGVRFGRIHLLGSERPLAAAQEPSAGRRGPNGAPMRMEMDMMESRYYARSADWPREMQQVRVFEVNTYHTPDGARATTRDTVEAWQQTKPAAGEVLVLSSQPYVRYQDAAVKAVLPRAFHVETVGDAAPRDLKISVAMDGIARQIDVGFARLQERLKMRRPRLEAQLVLIDPAEIAVDAATYQFRAGGDANGVTATGRLAAERWDPLLHGDPILVHERLDGRVFVADGHHRLELAKSLNARGEGPGRLAAMVLREADGYRPQDVKIIAAYKNIAAGKTDVVDTARVFKEAQSGAVHREMLPQLQMDKGNLRLAFTLSKLSDATLDAVQRGDVTPEAAAAPAAPIPARSVPLTQEYRITEPARATQLRCTVTPLDILPGFAQKLTAQRAAAGQSLSRAG